MRETEQALKQAQQAGNLPAAAPLAKALLKASPKDTKLRQTLSKIYSAMVKTGESMFRDAIAGYHHAIGAGLSGC